MPQPTTIVWDLNDGGVLTPVPDSVVANPVTNTNPGGDTFLLHMPAERVLDGMAFGGWWAWDGWPVMPHRVYASDPVLGDDTVPVTVTLTRCGSCR